MRIALLTTDTTHHAYYAQKLAERFPLALIVVETREAHVPFETFHPFEAERDAYERDVLLAGVDRDLSSVAPVHAAETANDAAARLRALGPDAMLVFGTGRLLPDTISSAPVCLNLHGGNPEEYRGLDTHLWAVYHRDFDNLVAALHHVDADIDSGDLVGCMPIPLRRGMPLHELRSRNTEMCVDLSLKALTELDESGRVAGRPQAKRGRYYSYMPAVLKDRCVAQFERRTASL